MMRGVGTCAELGNQHKLKCKVKQMLHIVSVSGGGDGHDGESLESGVRNFTILCASGREENLITCFGIGGIHYYVRKKGLFQVCGITVAHLGSSS